MQKKLLTMIIIVLSLFVFIGCNDTNLITTQPPTTESPSTDMPTTDTPTTETPTTETTTTHAPITEPIATIESIEITDYQVFYELNESFNYDALEITVTFSNDETYFADKSNVSIRSFNTSTPGQKTLSIIYEGALFNIDYVVLEEYAFEIDMEYYEEAINLKGDMLHVALNNIISEGFIDLFYRDAIGILEESDVDPENPDNVIVAYPGEYGESVPTGYSEEISGYYWNREHVWPQSRLGVYVSYTDDFPSKATDVHNLKPSDPDENSRRSNHYFDYFDTNDTFEPRDEVKGDVARIIFYMATRYFDLTLNNDPLTSSGLKTMGILSVLLEWNELDPVDEFEMNRNNVIHEHQGNRNPFIDYPMFAELIWGELAE
ncbi:MAG: endonuclease I family protein [Candidatus Izemoplasmatales bacterium]